MYFKRDIWKELLYWKDYSDVTLEVQGARQVGKTFILKKFCQENFKQFIYVNMAEKSGKDFLGIKARVEESVGITYQTSSKDNIKQIITQYYPDFVDSFETIILFDEIQESSEIFNLIRIFTREFETKFIVTGSYLGKLLDREFFLPAGDLVSIDMYSMSFPEFLGAFHLRQEYEQCYKQKRTSKTFKQFFELYTQIGGYPSVVKTFIETRDRNSCFSKLEQIINVFISESTRYFDSIEDIDVFKSLMSKISILGMSEKKGKNLVEDLNKIVTRPGDSRIKKESIDKTIGWLHNSSILGYAGKMVDGDPFNSVERSRYYFQDLGLAYIFALGSKFDMQTIHGYLGETYVYHTLRNKCYSRTIRKDNDHLYSLGTNPMFSTYVKIDGELDFVLFGSFDGVKNGIEVKWNDGKAVTGSAMLRDSIIDNLYLFMGNCEFKEQKNVKMIPLYFADLVDYTLTREVLSPLDSVFEVLDAFDKI